MLKMYKLTELVIPHQTMF